MTKQTSQVSVAINSIWSAGATLFGGAVQLAAIPVVVAGIGDADYGLYVLVLTIGGFVMLADLGLNEAIVRFVAKYHTEGDVAGIQRVLGATCAIYVIVGIVGMAAFQMAAPWLIGLFKVDNAKLATGISTLRLSGFVFLITVWVGVLEAIPQAVRRFDYLAKIQAGYTILNAVGMIIVVKLGYGLLGLVGWLICSNFIKVAALRVLVRNLLPGLRFTPCATRAGIKEVFSYGMFSCVNAVIARMYEGADRLLLGVFLGPADITFLSVPKQMLDYGATLHGAAGKVLFPRFSAMKDDLQMQHLYLECTSALLCVSLVAFVPIMAAMPDLLRLWMGSDFSQKSQFIAQLIAGSYALQGAFAAYFALLKGTGRVHWLSTILLSFGLIGIGLAALLIYSFGLLGAGIRAWLMLAVGFVVIGLICKRVFAMNKVGLRLLKLLGLPIAEAAFFFLISIFVWRFFAGRGFLWIITGWLSMTALLGVVLGLTHCRAFPTSRSAEFLAGLLTKMNLVRFLVVLRREGRFLQTSISRHSTGEIEEK